MYMCQRTIRQPYYITPSTERICKEECVLFHQLQFKNWYRNYSLKYYGLQLHENENNKNKECNNVTTNNFIYNFFLLILSSYFFIGIYSKNSPYTFACVWAKSFLWSKMKWMHIRHETMPQMSMYSWELLNA